MAHITPKMGKITAGEAGTATITGTITVDGVDYTDTCSVTVTGGGGDVSITLEQESMNLEAGSSTTLSAYPEPNDATITWESSNPSVVSIEPAFGDNYCSIGSNDAVGTAVITATATSGGSSASATCVVTVTPTIYLSSYTDLVMTGTSQTVGVFTAPSGQPYTLTSSDPSVISVNGNELTAESSGTASIIAEMTYDGVAYSSTAEITVSDTPLVDIVDDSVTVPVPGTFSPYAKTCPAGQSVSYTSSDDTVLAWNSELSCFEGIAPGTATVTATMTYDGTDYTDTCTVTVTSE